MICKLIRVAVVPLCAPVCVVASAGRADAQATSPIVVTQHSEAPNATAAELPRQLVINIGAGGTYNSGNTQSIAGNAGGQIAYKKRHSQVAFEVLGTVGYADDPSDDTTDYERNSGGVIGRGRYDLFLSQNDALFLAVQPRRDVNAGLNLRLQNQIGYLRNIFQTGEDHRLWTEAGYDLTYDNFSRITTTTTTDITSEVDPDLTMDPEDGVMGTVTRTTSRDVKPDPELIHSARVFFGYVNRLNAVATASLGVETLIEPKEWENVRVNAVADLTSSLSARFKLGIQFRALYDNVPVPGKEKLDTITALQLIYNYDSLTPPPAAVTCDCSAEVSAAEARCAERFVCPPVVPAEPVTPVAEVPTVGNTPTGPATSSAAELPVSDATAPSAQPSAAPEVSPAP